LKLKFSIFFLFVCLAGGGQTQSDVLSIADSMPVFPGGVAGIGKHFVSNLVIPAFVRENSNGEKTYVRFIVDTNGRVVNPVVVKASAYKAFDNEALRVISIMPLWEPARDKNKKVSVFMTLPVSFKDLGLVSAPLGEPKLTPEQREKHEKAMVRWNEGHKFEKQYMFDKALEKFNESLTFETNNKYALYDKGKMHMVLDEKNKACETWNKMIQNDIRKPEAEEAIKKYCAIENGHKEMLRYYDNIKAGDFFTSAITEVENKKYDTALRNFDSCLKYRPEHKDALFNKASVHLKLDQKSQACNAWEKLIALNKNDIEVQDLIKKHCN
jgi:TonB family protein